MNRIILVFMLLLAMLVVVKAQVVQVPVTPTAQEFLKYGEVPVSEYTGIPNISIPIYSIVEDDVDVPIKLTYHAGGIRVTDEASWVGLGWNLQFGSVVQIIMGHDDFIKDPMFSKKLPDYHGSPIPTDFPKRYQWPFLYDGFGWSSPYPVYAPTDNHSFKIATDYWVPMKGNFNQQHQDLFDGNYVDSQPDIIKINFLGHSLNVVVKSTGALVVLNEVGYVVKRTNPTSDDWGWEVVTPGGNTFSFEMKCDVDIDYNYSSTPQSEKTSGPLSSKSQKQWYLTEIKTTKNKTIKFNYGIISNVTNFPSYSQKYIDYEKGVVTTTGSASCTESLYALVQNVLTTDLVDYVFRTSQKVPYLTDIEFTNGRIQFATSNRDDVLGARKLDKVTISNNKQIIKQFALTYDYFVASNSSAINNAGGLAGLDENKEKKRLKLLSLNEIGKEPYEFKYNATELPYKNTFAVDYWGFYNGNHNNNSLIPNPSRFGNCDLENINSNNHSANQDFAKAGMLEKIIYPTKGITEFDFELNEFDNYWVPSYKSTSNTTSVGNGLRIRAIINKDQNRNFIGKTIYRYEGGKSIVPRSFFNSYEISCYNIEYKERTNYYATEIFSSNGYSTNLFGSINGVGYDVVKIRKTAVDESQTNGQRVLTFSNNPDKSYQMNHKLMSLPVIADRSKYANGSLLEEEISFSRGASYFTLKKITYDYEIKKSPIFYGAQIVPYPSFIYRFNNVGSCELGIKARHLIGYYPLYSDKTILKTKKVFDVTPFYSENSSVYTKTTYNYTPYNLLEAKTTYDKFDNELYKEFYSYPEYSSTLMKKNMLNTIVSKYIYKNNKFYTLEKYNYIDKGGLTLLNENLTFFEGFNYKTPRSIIYKEHDNVGNVTKYETSKGDINYIIWGYNQSYPIAKLVSSNEAISINELQTAMSAISLSGSDDKSAIDADIVQITNVISSFIQSIGSDMLTIYTYKPLVGLTSQTDPNGITTYYEYDNFGRLLSIKNNDNHVVQAYDYHYTGELDMPKTLNLSRSSLGFNSSSGSQNVSITSNVSWTVSDNASWISVSPGSGSNDGSISITCTSNASTSSRSGTITVSGDGVTKTVSITQAGAAPSSNLALSTYTLHFLPDLGLYNVNVTSNINWTVSSSAYWINLSTTSGSNNGSFEVECEMNPKSISRNGTITVTGGGLIKTISVSQVAGGLPQ